MATTNFADKKL